MLSTTRRVPYRVTDIINDGSALIVARCPARHEGRGHIIETIRFTIPAWMQERQGFIGQILNFDKGRPRGSVGYVSGFHDNGCSN